MKRSIQLLLVGIMMSLGGFLVAGCSDDEERVQRSGDSSYQNEGGTPHPPPHHDVRPK